MFIRPERPTDEDAIHALTEKAFAPMPFSSGTEAAIVRRLRAAGELTLSLVASIDGGIVGHAAFSPVTINGKHDDWFGLGPISVEHGMQRRGIGKALIASGLDTLRQRGAAGCALIGNPAIYARAGFESDGRLTFGSLDPRSVQRIVFRGSAPSGEMKFAAAFDSDPDGDR